MKWVGLIFVMIIMFLPLIALIEGAAPMNRYEPDPEFDEEHEEEL